MASPFDHIPLEVFDRILCPKQMKRWPCPDAMWDSATGERCEIRKDLSNYLLVSKTWHVNLQRICVEQDTLLPLAENATEVVVLRELAKLHGTSKTIDSEILRGTMSRAAKRGFIQVLEKLYDQLPSDIGYVVSVLENTLVSASAANMSECINRILVWRSNFPDLESLGIYFHDATDHGTSPVSLATIHGNVEAVKSLLAAGYKDETYTIWHRDALGYAAELGFLEIAEILLDADTTSTSTKHWNPKPWLVAREFPIEPTSGHDALQIACLRGNVDMTRLLILRGADYIAEDGGSFGPLACAVRSGNIKVVELLMEHGADINKMIEDWVDDTPLMVAAECDLKEMAEFLLARGADINLHGKALTPLITAAKFGNPDMVRLYLDHGAHVDTLVRKDCGTALAHTVSGWWLPARGNYHECASVLLDAGADIDTTWCDKRKYSAREIALKKNDPIMLRILGLDPPNNT